MKKTSKIYIAGHNGMVGSATLRVFIKNGFENLITASKEQLNLTNQLEVEYFFAKEKPEIVILCAAKVGGIMANINNPATFLLDNLEMQNNIIKSSYKYGVNKIVFLGSSCIYPVECPQPMKEEYLLSGKLELTNEGYAIAKIAGIKLLEGFRKQYGFNSISLVPCNLYGPNDSFDLAHAHVFSSLVKRFVDAVDENTKQITLWGTGIARREFMHVDDMARAIKFMLENYAESDFINVGNGTDVSIKELAGMIADFTGYKNEIKWDSSKPDGMLRKCMDVSRMKLLGFEPLITLEEGIQQMIFNYKKNKSKL